MLNFGRILSSYPDFRACITKAPLGSAEAEGEIENFCRRPSTAAIAFETEHGTSILITHFEIDDPEFRLIFRRYSNGRPDWEAYVEDKCYGTLSGSIRVPERLNEYLSRLLLESSLDYAVSLDELQARVTE